ncbi:hypothetical protein GCM10025791_39420 [Halioxenophilus aromaticivorans]|uniref:histidine kinase n=2 Tax=Halioxenophilus aromaticivorans TaxID=1306992 RepID=A0AAV3U7X0_9ALTE
MGIDGFAFWQWHQASQNFSIHGELCKLAGYDFDEVQCLTQVNQVRGLFHPDDLERSVAIIRHHAHHNTPIHLSFRLQRKTGGYMWVTTMANSLRDDSGIITDIVGVAFDASALHRTQEALRTAELRLQRIMNACNDGIWEWDVINDRMECSDRVMQHLGFNSYDEIALGAKNALQGWTRRIHAEDYPGFRKAVRKTYEEQSTFDVAYRVADRDGIYRWVRTRAVGGYDELGQLMVISGTNIDITEIKLAQDRMERARDDAESANLSKSKFLSGMSQELRTPMNAILGYAQLFEFDTNLTSQQRTNVREIRKAGEHLIQLIDDVLDLSKIESGNVNLTLEPVNIPDIARDCVALSQPQSSALGISFNTEIDESEDLIALCDRVRLKQVLLNLFSNGIKYNRTAGWVNVKIFVLDEDQVCISVEDNGYGISEAKQAELFQPFNRLGAEKTAIEGSGVGLVITKSLVEMMGGTISVYSQQDIGSCFEIHLPRCESFADDVSLSIDSIIDENKTFSLDLQSPKKILFIEDSAANARLMSKLFHHINNLALEVADEPLLGVYKARTEKPDVLLLDLAENESDTLEVIKILNSDSDTKSIPKLAFVNGASRAQEQKLAELGIVSLLSKPINIGQLMNALQRVLK